MTTIVMADDHKVVRQGLKALLEGEADFSVVAEASDGLQACELVEKHKPDVLVVDLMMPSLNGLDVARQVRKRFPRTQVILLSMHANEAYVLEALRNGAIGYVLKESGVTDLVRAVRQAAIGQRFLSPPLSDRAIQAYAERTQNSQVDPYDTLTSREREVFQLAAEGGSNREIAERLSISARTVETHLTNLMRKLDLSGRPELIRFAVDRGVISSESG